MKLTIHTPSSTIHHTINWLEINTPTGNYIIQRGHVPMILSLSPAQSMTFRLKNGKQETVLIEQGIVKVNRTSATVVMTAVKG